MAWLTNDLLEDIKLRGFFPSTGNITDAELLRIATSQIRVRLVPLTIRVEQEFWITHQDYTLSGREYRIPSEALLGRVRKVVLVDQAGNEYDVNPTSFDRLAYYSRDNGLGWYRKVFYALRGDMVTLTTLPSDSAAYQLRVYYYRRPPELVLTTQCAQLFDGKFNDEGTTDGAPGTGWVVGDFLEVRQPEPNFDVLASVQYVLDGGTFFEWTPSLYPPGGDPTPFNNTWICIKSTSCVVAVPDLMYELLVSATVYQTLLTLGFFDQAQIHKADLVERELEVMRILEPRKRAPAEKVINWSGPLRKGSR